MTSASESGTRKLLEETVVEFFGALGIECGRSAETQQDRGPEVAAIIGFRGQDVRGALAFVAPLSLIEQTLPVRHLPDRVGHQLRDWTMEISNQLLGRLKNKLLNQAISFASGTPVCLRGRQVRMVFLPEAEGVSLAMRAASHDLEVHLDCAIAPDQPSGPVEDLRIVAEGDVILF